MINKKKIFTISHDIEGTSGPINKYTDYLISRKYLVHMLSHPLDNYSGKSSTISLNNKLIKSYKRYSLNLINLILDFLLSINCIYKTDFSVFIGSNNFDTFSAIFSRKILRKRIERIIYFSTDYSEKRFKNLILDKIYALVEKIVVKYSDLTISNTKRAESERKKLGLLKKNSLVLPNGVNLPGLVFKKKKILKHSFIYIGSVSREHGLYEFINIAYPLMKKIVIIGYGDEMEKIKDLCKDKKISLKHYRYKHRDFVINYMQKFSGFGLAPYTLDNKWTYYCSPMKVVEYLACGVPVLMSSVPEISSYIKENGLGIVYSKLDLDGISHDLEFFETANFNIKAKKSYAIYNQNNLYSKINL